MRNNNYKSQAVELGTIDYVNLDDTQSHSDIKKALEVAMQTGKPLFCNFVEWSGWQGCKDAGRIFADARIKRVAEELFVPCAFNTWDRSNPTWNEPFKRWGGRLKSSWWGYLRIVDCEGKSVIAESDQITGYHACNNVKAVIINALKSMEKEVPDYL